MESRSERRERERREEERRERRIREIERELELEEARKRVKKGRRKKNVAGKIVASALAIIVALMIFQAWKATKADMVEPIVEPSSGDFEDSPRINILFLGNNGGLSDTFMVFSYNVETNCFAEISIPRDTYYNRPNYSGAAYQKINSVYGSEGYVAAATAASKVLGGVPIHYYVVLEPDGAKKIFDAMGGVYVNVPMDMYYVDEGQGLKINLKAGPQLLNGDQTMQYLRYRSGYVNGDLGRISAQQEFLRMVVNQSSGLDYPKIAWTARAAAQTNISMPAGVGLVLRASGMSSGSFNTHTIPGTTGMQDGLSYFFHDGPGTRNLMRTIYAS